MKRLMILTTLLFTAILTSSVWSHHPAEGIVSDEIWQAINQRLIDMNSPHLTIDFGTLMDSMGVTTDSRGKPLLVTSIEVLPEDLPTYQSAIEYVLSGVNRVPSGNTGSGMASTLEVKTTGPVDGVFTISIFEPVGSGESQNELPAPAEPAPSKPEPKKKH